MKLSRTIAMSVVVAACFVAAPASAQSRDFVAYASTTPILYRYAACIFEGDAASAEAQIEQCSALKTELEAEADAVIERFHAGDRRDVDLELFRGFREIDREAGLTRSRNRPVPAAFVGYLKCMGEGAMSQADYQSGTAVTYDGVERPCEDAMRTAATNSGASERELDSIDRLHRRLQISRRVTYSQLRLGRLPSNSRFEPQPVWLMDRGFLNVSLIREQDDG